MRCALTVVAAVVVILLTSIPSTASNDFSSFLSANASLAVVVDHEYVQRRGENVMANFHKILSDIVRENLRNGGVNVKYFSWNAVHLKKDFLAAMTVTDCENTWNFYEATQLTSVLLIAITDSDCPRLPFHRAMMIPIVDNGDELSQMLLDIKVQKILKWKTAILLVDENILNVNAQLIKSIVYESTRTFSTPISVMLFKIDSALRGQRKRTVLRQLLGQFVQRPNEHQQFMVVSPFYEDIIEVADALGMFHVFNQWLFFVFNTNPPRDFDAAAVTQNLNEGANIAFVLNETQSGCVDSLNCTIAEISMAFVNAISRMITEEQAIYAEISDEEWESIRFTKEQKQDEVLSYMKDHLKTNSKCASCARWRVETAITWGKSQESRKIKSINRETQNKNFDFINIGYWTPLLGFVTGELTFPHMEHYFRNISMDVITVHNPPWQILRRDAKGDIVEHTGIVMEILKELSLMLNFTYTLREAFKANNWDDDAAMINRNESLLGTLTHLLPYEVVKLVQDDRMFLAAVATTIDEPNKQPFNYTIPISVQKYSFISRRPDEISRIYLFTAPFTLETWACLFGALLLTAPILYAVNLMAPLHEWRVKGLCTLKNCFWYVYGALLQQGGMYLPKADSGRLVIGVWWIVVIVLVTTYCGNLVAFLTFPKFQPGLDYFFQLRQSHDVTQFGLRNGTFFEKYVATSTNRRDFHWFLDRAIIYNNQQEENIAAVEQGQRVNVDWRINLQLVIQNHFERDKECKYALAKEDFVEEQIGMIMPTNSPYLQLINEQIMRLFRMGFIERWHQMNLPSMDKCSGHGVMRQITNHKVNLDDMQGCFLVLLLGFILALFVMLVEFWCHRFNVRQRGTATNRYAT